MTVVAIEEVKKLQARIAEINSIPLDKIVWTENDKPVEIVPEVKTFFKFTGLSNCSFITDDYYLEKQHG